MQERHGSTQQTPFSSYREPQGKGRGQALSYAVSAGISRQMQNNEWTYLTNQISVVVIVVVDRRRHRHGLISALPFPAQHQWLVIWSAHLRLALLASSPFRVSVGNGCPASGGFGIPQNFVRCPSLLLVESTFSKRVEIFTLLQSLYNRQRTAQI
jgi:hypothetical protein